MVIVFYESFTLNLYFVLCPVELNVLLLPEKAILAPLKSIIRPTNITTKKACSWIGL